MRPGPESIELVDVKKDRTEMENCQRVFGNSFEKKELKKRSKHRLFKSRNPCVVVL